MVSKKTRIRLSMKLLVLPDTDVGIETARRRPSWKGTSSFKTAGIGVTGWSGFLGWSTPQSNIGIHQVGGLGLPPKERHRARKVIPVKTMMDWDAAWA
jgi:hypothetical protein